MSSSHNMRSSRVRLLDRDEWKLMAARRLRTADAAPYLASLLLAMPVYAVDGITAAVDRSARLYLGMDFFRSLSDDQAVGLLLHEVRHIVHGHGDRAEAQNVTSEDRPRWNVAADLTINDELTAGGFQLPDDGVSASSMNVPTGKTAEVYFELLREQRPPDDTASCGSGAGGLAAEWEFGDADDSNDRGGDSDGLGRGLSPLDLQLQRRHVAGEITHHVAKHGIGSIPGDLQRWAEELLRPPTIHWRELLRTAVRRPLQVAAGVDDYTWTRRNRRRQSGNVILPATISVVPDVAVVVDTSGSIGSDELASFVAEIVGMAGQFRIQARDVQVIACDAQAYPPLSADLVVGGAHLSGGGGTDMGTGITAAAELRPRPDLVVVFTDGYTPWPNRSSVPVVVALSNGSASPDSVPDWATVVQIDESLSRR